VLSKTNKSSVGEHKYLYQDTWCNDKD